MKAPAMPAGPSDSSAAAGGSGQSPPPAAPQPATAADARLPASVGRFVLSVHNGATLQDPPQVDLVPLEGF
eukprot:13072619-Alexandrium_andersonii.AAC.1